MSKRAITYARVSGDDRGKDGRNLAGQLEMGREYCAKHGYTIVAELAEDDRGASGASFELEQLGKILELAHNRGFDVLVVREVDRLSRSLAKQLIVEEWLKRDGVDIEYVLGEYPNNPEGNLMKHVRAVVAEYEREKIRERIQRGKRLKVKSGSVMTNGTSRPPYGYTVIEVDNKWKLQVYEPEARVVRMIYDWYAYGDDNGDAVSMREVARKLGEMKVPTRLDTNPKQGGYKKRGYAEWSKGQLANLFASEVYKGIWTYGKRSTNGIGKGADPISITVPSIVKLETWLIVEDRRKHNQKEAAGYRKNTYLLSGRMKCGHCGSSFNGEANKVSGYKYYRCQAIHKGSVAHKCDISSFRMDRVETVIWDWVIRLLTNPESLKDGLTTRLSKNEKETSPLRDRLKIAEDMLLDNKKQLERLVDLYLSGEFSKDIIIDRKSRLEDSIKALENEKISIIAMLEKRTLTPKQISNIYQFAERIGSGLNFAEKDPAIKRQVIEALDIRVVFAVEDGEKVVYSQCVLDDKPEKFGLSSINKPSPFPTR